MLFGETRRCCFEESSYPYETHENLTPLFTSWVLTGESYCFSSDREADNHLSETSDPRFEQISHNIKQNSFLRRFHEMFGALKLIAMYQEASCGMCFARRKRSEKMRIE